MAYTQAQLDALEAAIATGATRVRYADKEVIYRNLDEMQRIRLQMRRDLGLQTNSTRVVSRFSKGLR